jgi:dTMP kinase
MSLFITFEGVEGSGKSTQARLLYQRLQEQDYPVILTREPGGTRISELIRRILTDLQHTEMASTTETLLFAAARAQLVNELIRPYLETGSIVLCDRYADSTYAYQGYGLGRDMDELYTLTQIATGGLTPDVTIYLDLPAEAGIERKQQGKQAYESSRQAYQEQQTPANMVSTSQSHNPLRTPLEWNRLDARDIAYHKRVEDGFRELMQHEPNRWHRFDAQQPMHTILAEIEQTIEPYLKQITRLAQSPV